MQSGHNDQADPRPAGIGVYALVMAHRQPYIKGDTQMEKFKVWGCKLVIPSSVGLPSGFDSPPRSAVQMVIEGLDIPIVCLFSGWGGTLVDTELVVANQQLANMTDAEVENAGLAP